MSRPSVPELDPIERVTQQMTSTLDLDEVLAAVTRGLIEDVGAALARIWLVEPAGAASADRALRLRASSGLSTRLDGALARVPLGALKIGQIAVSREPIHADDLQRDERIPDKEWVRSNGLVSFAGYPLMFRDEVLGVLAVFSRRALSDVERSRLSLFANRAAIAIQNARLHAELAALKARLEDENVYLHEELRRGQGASEILGDSPALLAALDKLQKVAPTPSTVLLLGETGTGKELFARALHAASSRRDGPLVKVSCAAIAPGLVESELFGHEKGAFTSAVARRLGRFELAKGGTLFLDEVGELPPEAQSKLLRVLQEREMERVGGAETIRVEVRVVAATNRDLAADVKGGRFRADLYYRLAVFPIEVPPLRARRDDVVPIARAFVQRQAAALRKPLRGLTREAEAALAAYDWPGNVRELHNVIERAAILARGELVGRDELPDLAGAARRESPARDESASRDEAPARDDARTAAGAAVDTSSAQSSPRTLEHVERAHIEGVLRDAAWVVEGPSGAAAALGLSPSTLRSRMARLGIRRPRGRS